MSDKSKNVIPRPRRLPLRLPVTVTNLHTFLDSEIMNLSKGGVFIHSDIVLPLGSDVDFQFVLPSSGKVIHTSGIVVWARKAGTRSPLFPTHPSGMGVQFKNIERRDVELIVAELEQAMEIS